MPTTPQLQRIPLSQIRPDPTQSRTSFNKISIEELAASIKENGQLSPIAVRKVGSTYQIIYGERRFRACSFLNKEEMDAFVYPEETTPLETEILSLIENLQRVDLNPIEEARGYKQLIGAHHLGIREIGRMVGKGHDVISRALDLLNLPDELQSMVARATISPRHARVLFKITNVERQIALAKLAEAEDWSVKETERRIKEELEATGKTGSKSGGHSQKPESPLDQFSRSTPEMNELVNLIHMAPIEMDEPDTWRLQYVAENTIAFQLHLEGKNLKAKLARWAGELAKTLGFAGLGKEDPEETQLRKLRDLATSNPNEYVRQRMKMRQEDEASIEKMANPSNSPSENLNIPLDKIQEYLDYLQSNASRDGA